MSTPLENLLDKRKLRSGRKPDSLANFYEKRNRATKLVEYAHKSKNRKVIAEANNYYIIALVTAFEVYMSDLLNELINTKKIDPLDLKINPKREYPIREVVFLIRNKVSIGELFCNTLNFENMSDLGLLLSSLFSINNQDFFGYLKKYRFKYISNRGAHRSFIFENDFYPKLKTLFESRHKIVHDLTFKNTPTRSQLWKMGGLITNFVHAIEILSNKFRNNRSCEVVKK
jgi:hypothetical protein